MFSIIYNDYTDGDCLMGEVDAVVAGTSCDRRRHGTVVCSGAESSVSPKSDISKNITYTVY